jgi:hypothetical protein
MTNKVLVSVKCKATVEYDQSLLLTADKFEEVLKGFYEGFYCKDHKQELRATGIVFDHLDLKEFSRIHDLKVESFDELNAKYYDENGDEIEVD